MRRKCIKGFSLVELLVVIGILAVFLVMGTALFRNAGQGESRQAVRSLMKVGLNSAQTRALTTGKPVAFVMTPYEQGRFDQLGRSFTLFEVRRDDVTGNYIAGEQLRRWAQLPGRFIFSKGDTVSASGQNAFNQEAVVNISVSDERGGRFEANMPAIIFGGSGSVVWPSGEGELEIHLMEGTINDHVPVGFGDQLSDWAKREVFVIGRQTGRARFLQTQ